MALEVLAEPDLRDRFARPRLVGAERDLVEHALGDEVASGSWLRYAARACQTSPDDASSSPVAILASVDFPAPFAPVSATISPRRTSSDAPSSATRRRR